ncbi:MAG: PLP-dependent aminotransferase family protein [Pseudomonadota bacterium]
MSFALDVLNKSLSNPKLGVMNFLNEIVNRYPNIISFAPGRPLEKNFNVEKSLGYINRYLETVNIENASNHGYSFLGQYGNTKGIIGDIVCKLILNDEGIVADSSSIVTTVGCQEAMCLCLIALAGNPDEVVLVEDPAYVGIVGAAKLFGIEVVGVPTNENGIIVESLSYAVDKLRKANKTPKLLYVSPDFSNPTGFTSSLERRAQLLDVTRKLGLIILEDHAYNYFYFNDSRIGCLKSHSGSEHVIYLGSFSKSIYPGIRIGFLVADQKINTEGDSFCNLSDELSKIKSFLTVNSSPLNQAIVGGLIVDQNYSLIDFTAKSRAELKLNRDIMLESLIKYFPKHEPWCNDIEWNIPAGGFFITLKLPFCVSDAELFSCVENYGVIWTPMSYFYVREVLSSSIRLSFSYVNRTQIVEGIERLSLFVQEHSRIININQ